MKKTGICAALCATLLGCASVEGRSERCGCGVCGCSVSEEYSAAPQDEPTPDAFLDDIPCELVVQNPSLYDGRFVLWPGHLFNGRLEDGVYKCSFFVSDDEQSRILGIFDMKFDAVPSEPLTGDSALDVLARISVGEGADGRAKVTLMARQYAVHRRGHSSVQARNSGAE